MKRLTSHLTCSVVSGGEQKFCTTNPRNKSIKFCSIARKYLLLLRAKRLSELLPYFNFAWWTPSEFFLISVSVFKPFPLLSLDWTRWFVGPASIQERQQIQGWQWHWPPRLYIYVLAEWQDILKGLREKHDPEFLCLVKLPRMSPCLPLLCPSCLWSCLLLDPETRQHSHNHPMENCSPFWLNPGSLSGSICGSAHKWVQSPGNVAEAPVLVFED